MEGEARLCERTLAPPPPGSREFFSPLAFSPPLPFDDDSPPFPPLSRQTTRPHIPNNTPRTIHKPHTHLSNHFRLETDDSNNNPPSFFLHRTHTPKNDASFRAPRARELQTGRGVWRGERIARCQHAAWSPCAAAPPGCASRCVCVCLSHPLSRVRVLVRVRGAPDRFPSIFLGSFSFLGFPCFFPLSFYSQKTPTTPFAQREFYTQADSPPETQAGTPTGGLFVPEPRPCPHIPRPSPRHRAGAPPGLPHTRPCGCLCWPHTSRPGEKNNASMKTDRSFRQQKHDPPPHRLLFRCRL